jgi:sulfate transport system ATP-binding protein
MYVEVRDIDKHFGAFHALDHISFGVEKGELIALLGASGSGKTTILRTIAGLETADSGDIVIDGKVVDNVPGSQRGIGFVFQDYALFRYMTVYDNIAFGLRVKGADRKKVDARVRELIDLIGLTGREDRYPNQLSGDQRQRVAFARAIAPNPQVLLLDEPFAAIDAKIRGELRQWLREMITQLGITSIFVTHDQEEAIEVSDRIIVMSNGKIEQVGTPTEIYEEPQTAFVAKFAGNAPVVADYDCFNGFEKTDPDSVASVRPEFVEAFRPDNPEFAEMIDVSQEAVVKEVSFRGFYFELTLDIAGIEVHAHRGLGRRRPIKPGMHMLAYIDRLYIMHGDNSVEVVENPALKGKIVARD